jgi:hypothetical protein
MAFFLLANNLCPGSSSDDEESPSSASMINLLTLFAFG